MKIILFGTGEGYELYKPWFSCHEIIALLDNDEKKIGTFRDGIPILSPKEVIKKNYDAVFVLSIDYSDEMREQLAMLGVPIEKIFSYEQIVHGLKKEILWQPLTLYCPDNAYSMLMHDNRLRIAFITFDLCLSGGAGLGFLWTITALERYREHCCVHLISRHDGPLRSAYLELGIPVMIDPNLYVKTLDDIAWKDDYDLLFFNTIHFANVFLRNSSNMPMIWWIHDSNMIYRGHAVEWLDSVPQNNVSVYAVADLAEEAFRHRCPSWKVKHLSYGLVDRVDASKIQKYIEGKIVFAVIGYITERKAQDVFLRAIDLMPNEKRMACEFWIIGRDTSVFAKKLKKIAESMEDVHFWGEVSEEELHDLYQKVSVLVCPSLEDPMPGVCTEAMMYHHPCLVSDGTGTAQYITPKKDGLVCRVADAADLAEKLTWFVDNAEQIASMGEASRAIYDQHFTMESFEHSLFAVLDENLRGRFPDGFFQAIR